MFIIKMSDLSDEQHLRINENYKMHENIMYWKKARQLNTDADLGLVWFKAEASPSLETELQE